MVAEKSGKIGEPHPPSPPKKGAGRELDSYPGNERKAGGCWGIEETWELGWAGLVRMNNR